MIHISKLKKERVEKVEDVVNIGDKVRVKSNRYQRQGRCVGDFGSTQVINSTK